MSEKFSSYVIGGTTLLIRCVSYLLSEGHQVLGIISADDKVRKFAADQHIPFHSYQDLPNLVSEIEKTDYLFSIVNLKIIPDSVIFAPGKLAINYHDGPLPRYAGLHAPQWALLNHEKTHGVTWHVMENEFDSGDILEQVIFPITQDETALSIDLKCYQHASESFKKMVNKLENGIIERRKQDLSQRTVCPPPSALKKWK